VTPRLIITIGLVLRIAVAVWNGFFGPSLGAELDAQTFYLTALSGSQLLLFVEWNLGPETYINFLMLFFYLINNSLFFGSLLSCFAWLASAILLLRAVQLFNPDGMWRIAPFWVFTLAPTSILNTAVTLREPFQLLFLNLAIYGALRIGITRSKLHWITFALGCIGASYLHPALLGFNIIFLPATLAFALMVGRETIPWGRIVFVLIMTMILVPLAMSYFSYQGRGLTDGLINASLQYQEGGLSTDARANYKAIDYNLGSFGALLSLVVGFFQYLLEPLPWNITTFADFGLFLENIVRMWLIWVAYLAIRATRGPLRISLIYVLAMFIGLEVIWSLGTVNWGTASRHHVPGLGLLALAACVALKRRVVKEDPSVEAQPLPQFAR
jgi:hypothetical protein